MSEPLPRDLAECHAALQELARRLSRAYDEERERIAGELHDDLGQTLAAVQLRVFELAQATSPAAREATAGELEQLVRGAIESTRALTFELLAPALPEVGIVAGLRELVEGFSTRQGMAVRYEAGEAVGRLAPGAARTVYRVVGELLRNVAKHARAQKVTVRVEGDGADLTVTVADDGIGMPARRSPTGFGLLIARARLEEVGGRLDLTALPDGGTSARLILPIEGGTPP